MANRYHQLQLKRHSMSIEGQSTSTNLYICIIAGFASGGLFGASGEPTTMLFMTLSLGGFCIKILSTCFFGVIGALGGILAKEIWKACRPFLLERLKEKVNSLKSKK